MGKWVLEAMHGGEKLQKTEEQRAHQELELNPPQHTDPIETPQC